MHTLTCIVPGCASCRPGGYRRIQEYGEQYAKAGKSWPKRKPVRLLYTGGNHYDLLTKQEPKKAFF